MSGTTLKGLKANLAKTRELQRTRPDLNLDDLVVKLEQLLGARRKQQRSNKPRKKR